MPKANESDKWALIDKLTAEKTLGEHDTVIAACTECVRRRAAVPEPRAHRLDAYEHEEATCPVIWPSPVDEEADEM